MANEVVALTTVDNPFDPINNFIEWFKYDELQGYGTCAYLGRIARTSEVLTDEENQAEIERAIDEIVKYNPDVYKKVTAIAS